VPLAAWIPRALSPALRARDPMPALSALFLLGWSGMRGIVTLAAALALPTTTAAGTAFPFRAEIILLSFSVILVTLVLQGLTLAPLIRVMKLEADREFEQEEMLARERAVKAALAHLETVAGNGWIRPELVERLKGQYSRRAQRFAPSAPVDPECTREAADAQLRLRQETLAAERRALIGLRNDGTISDEVLHRLEQELDLEAVRLGLDDHRPRPKG